MVRQKISKSKNTIIEKRFFFFFFPCASSNMLGSFPGLDTCSSCDDGGGFPELALAFCCSHNNLQEQGLAEISRGRDLGVTDGDERERRQFSGD